jgi:hypothetical protein
MLLQLVQPVLPHASTAKGVRTDLVVDGAENCAVCEVPLKITTNAKTITATMRIFTLDESFVFLAISLLR